MYPGTRTIGLAAAVVLCAAGTARASAETMVKATVPFAFEVNGHTMPAGTYLIQRDDMSSPSVLIIRNANRSSHATALVSTLPDNGRDPAGSQPALTFTRHERQYRLATVWQSTGEGFDVNNR